MKGGGGGDSRNTFLFPLDSEGKVFLRGRGRDDFPSGGSSGSEGRGRGGWKGRSRGGSLDYRAPLKGSSCRLSRGVEKFFEGFSREIDCKLEWRFRFVTDVNIFVCLVLQFY